MTLVKKSRGRALSGHIVQSLCVTCTAKVASRPKLSAAFT